MIERRVNRWIDDRQRNRYEKALMAVEVGGGDHTEPDFVFVLEGRRYAIYGAYSCTRRWGLRPPNTE